MTWTRRQRRMAVKAELLDYIANDVIRDMDVEPQHGLSVEEVGAVYEELAAELYARAVRITPVVDRQDPPPSTP